MDVISVPTTEATKKRISFEDYLLMPEINHPYEIIDGKFIEIFRSKTSSFKAWIQNGKPR